MRLRANAIDRNSNRDPFFDFRRKAFGLSVGGRVEVVVVDVELCSRVGLPCGFESDADEVFAEYVGKDAGPKRAVLIEDLVDDILRQISVGVHEEGTTRYSPRRSIVR